MTENNFSFTPMANEDISIHIGSVPGAAAESGAPAASASPVSAQQPEAGMRPASPMARRKRDFFEWEFTKKMNAVGL